ncbi:uncharacterized protein LOC113764470 isoform X2 [Coffea eugenioides]|uniref:uncharacterized protein LOC113764470 isoform X2 n=1 Tax=Coffea eugenioides TaxID=49369 RepID=UPI000F608E15|nr:uncharacterized protein LOC113764470 isoform X2 [Coffea eugenioides]
MAAKSALKNLFPYNCSLKLPPPKFPLFFRSTAAKAITPAAADFSTLECSSSSISNSAQKKQKAKNAKVLKQKTSSFVESQVKRRTRSDREIDEDSLLKYYGNDNSCPHVPVLLGEVLDVFASVPLRSFVDCTLGAAGHSSAVNNAERGFSVLNNGPLDMRMNPQASLKAEDILNSWPDAEVGKVLQEYGEESNWYHIQNKIVKARLHGGLHSTAELVDLIRSSASRTRGGRQGWIKTAIRVFQALRIAVNDELNTLQDSIHACFDSLASGGRLAVISFHSLEDRIVKQTFLDIINCNGGKDEVQDGWSCDPAKVIVDRGEKEAWIRRMISGQIGSILTKRPITPSEKEETLNPRSRSAKLRVIQKG